MKHLPIAAGGHVSRAFRQYIKSALPRVPAPALAALAADGWEVQLLPKADVLFAPSLSIAASFAATVGASYKKLRGATCMSGARVLAFFETHVDESGVTRTGPEAWIPGDQIVHEIGHALDRHQGERTGRNISDSPAFLTAYRQDVAALNKREREVFSYFLAHDKNSACQDQYARREVVAESFSQIVLDTKEAPESAKESLLHAWLGGVWEGEHARPFRDAFKNSLAVVEKSLVKPLLNTPALSPQAQPGPAI